MGQIRFLIDLFLHLDEHMANIINQYGAWTYAILFLVVFMETGFVITPFLPGDSLLFAAGTFAALGSMNVWLLVVLLIIAAIAGDTVNYWIGHYLVTALTTSNGSNGNIWTARMPSLKSMAARRFFSRASFPSFEHLHPLLPVWDACPTVISFHTMCSVASSGFYYLRFWDISLATFPL